ncbi:hypothetical protein DFH06DRAFT_1324585 [Mycena polygramma]|nr:hypothetical protein DFH06DRAFT_1324585 [Mycena polygramma]
MSTITVPAGFSYVAASMLSTVFLLTGQAIVHSAGKVLDPPGQRNNTFMRITFLPAMLTLFFGPIYSVFTMVAEGN